MNIKFILLLMMFLLTSLSFVFAVEAHCWRPNITRECSVRYAFDKNYSGEGSELVVPTNAKLNIFGFGDYTYQCENGASGHNTNYVYVLDNKTQKIIRTNGAGGVGGPNALTGPVMCVTDDAAKNACYLANGEYFPARYTCAKGAYTVGGGVAEAIDIMMTPFIGEQDWSIMMGLISPGGAEPTSPMILSKELVRLKFIVDSSKPAILIFPSNPLQKINSFNQEGDINKTVNFTLLNKSKVISEINSYEINCPEGVVCELEKMDDGTNMFNGFKLLPNQATIIPVVYSFNKNKIPLRFDSLMYVSYTPKGFTDCGAGGCNATSTAVRFESGLLDKQDFQINVMNEVEQKYCVDYDGRLGKTGSDYAPRINLYFGANISPSSIESSGTLVSLNECSPLDYNTMQPNPDWVYCTKNEFLVQLAARIGLYSKNMIAIENYESNGDFVSASAIRQKNGQIGTYTAYLRDQDLSLVSRNSSVETMLATLSNVAFTNIGFNDDTVITNVARFKNLINGMRLNKAIGGVSTNDTNFSPGAYKVTINLSRVTGAITSDLFNSGTDGLNPYMNLEVFVEKIAEPKLNWFFYYQGDNYAEELYVPTPSETYTTNYLDRGIIMNFEKIGDNTNLTKFYSTLAVPFIARIVDKGQIDVSDSSFKVIGAEYSNKDTFSIWTGFASSLGSGCGTTVVSPKSGSLALPYKIFDSNAGQNMYELKDLNEVKPDTRMYISTVLYLPTGNSNLQMELPFKVFTLDQTVEGTVGDAKTLIIRPEKYGAYTISSIKDVLDGMNQQKVCVYYDKSTEKESWKLFWNQDLVLDALKAQVKPTITDATVCITRDIQSS